MVGNPDLVIKTQIATKNVCYNPNRSIKPIELCLHSVGTPQPSAQKFATAWNNPNRAAKNLCHGVIDDKEAIITLNCMDTPGKVLRGSHGGSCTYNGVTKSSNNTAIGFETTEPSWIRYTGGANFTYNKADLPKIIDFETKVLNNAVEVYARLAVFHNITDFSINTVYCHAEGYSYKHNSNNHSDLLHILRQIPELGWSMDRFRSEVKQRAEEIELEDFIMSLDKDAVFDEYMSRWMTRQWSKKANSWEEEPLKWANDNGILKGNDKGNMGPQGLDTRGTLATVLKRYHDKFGKDK